jgi:hypothetical protein
MPAVGLAMTMAAISAPAQTLRAQSASTISFTGAGSEKMLEIHNVTYEMTGDSVPGRPRGERLMLRQIAVSKQIVGDKGQEADVTLEAWPLGIDPKQKPLYTIKASGTGGRTVGGALFVADRGLEEVEWWSVYRLGTGQHLFDTYVPLVRFSISKESMDMRYVGVEVPPDDAHDPRLRKPDVVAVITYASEQRVKRELILTCDDPKQAALLRSYWDTTRTMTVSGEKPPRALKMVFEANDGPQPASRVLTIPIASDDLDFAHAQLPAHLHLTPWKR